MAASKGKKASKGPRISQAAAGKSNLSPVATDMRMGKPRFDPYEKLIHLFFEPLIMLYALGQTRSAHTRTSLEDETLEFKRQRFLNNLCYLCDYEKGGDTTTAIAVEELDDRFVFWYALNKNDGNKVAPFLESVLDFAKKSLQPQTNQDGEARLALISEFTVHCLEFASRRVKKELKLLQQNIRGCKSQLMKEPSQGATRLADWLCVFYDIHDDLHACSLAYEHRHDLEMAELERRGQQDLDSAQRNHAVPFANVHHLIGRLASHIRNPLLLLQDAECMQRILDSDFEACRAPIVLAVPRPQLDDLTQLELILKRMGQLPGSEASKAYLEAANQLKAKYDLLDRIKKQYEDPNFKPKVHAEIQLHELFWKDQKRFAFDHRVIGCSKPACYCCHLYIRHHPAQCVEPAAHHKIWLNWSPPQLEAGAADPGFIVQRKLLYRIMEHVRVEALENLKRRGQPSWHPDSTTGITRRPTEPVAAGPGLSESNLERYFEGLSLGPSNLRTGPIIAVGEASRRAGSPVSSESSSAQSSGGSSTQTLRHYTALIQREYDENDSEDEEGASLG